MNSGITAKQPVLFEESRHLTQIRLCVLKMTWGARLAGSITIGNVACDEILLWWEAVGPVEGVDVTIRANVQMDAMQRIMHGRGLLQDGTLLEH
jgi:hypothetical protein